MSQREGKCEEELGDIGWFHGLCKAALVTIPGLKGGTSREPGLPLTVPISFPAIVSFVILSYELLGPLECAGMVLKLQEGVDTQHVDCMVN